MLFCFNRLMITNLRQQYRLDFAMKNRFVTEQHTMFNSCYWNRHLSPLTVQYKSFFRYIKPHKDVCGVVEYNVLSLFLVFFFGFLYYSFLNLTLCLFGEHQL